MLNEASLRIQLISPIITLLALSLINVTNLKTKAAIRYNGSLLIIGITLGAIVLSVASAANAANASNFTGSKFVVNIVSHNFTFYVDGLSVFLVLLTGLILYLCVVSLDVNSPRLYEHLIQLLFLQLAINAAFMVRDLLGFFIFFEITLVSIYFLVII
jgi:NADH-quinone oxidoreductase subunit M